MTDAQAPSERGVGKGARHGALAAYTDRSTQATWQRCEAQFVWVLAGQLMIDGPEPRGAGHGQEPESSCRGVLSRLLCEVIWPHCLCVVLSGVWDKARGEMALWACSFLHCHCVK